MNYDNGNDDDQISIQSQVTNGKLRLMQLVFFFVRDIAYKMHLNQNGNISSFRFRCIVTILMWIHILFSLSFLHSQQHHIFFRTSLLFVPITVWCAQIIAKKQSKMTTKWSPREREWHLAKWKWRKWQKKKQLTKTHTHTQWKTVACKAPLKEESNEKYIYSVKKECWWFSALHIKCQFMCMCTLCVPQTEFGVRFHWTFCAIDDGPSTSRSEKKSKK